MVARVSRIDCTFTVRKPKTVLVSMCEVEHSKLCRGASAFRGLIAETSTRAASTFVMSDGDSVVSRLQSSGSCGVVPSDSFRTILSGGFKYPFLIKIHPECNSVISIVGIELIHARNLCLKITVDQGLELVVAGNTSADPEITFTMEVETTSIRAVCKVI